jgi:hypothetical protein
LCAFKRLVVGLILGRQTFAHYGKELTVVMKNMVLLGAVATLAREIEKDKDYYVTTETGGRLRSSTDDWMPDEISDFVSKQAEVAMKEAEEEKMRTSVMLPTAPEAAKAFLRAQQKSEPLSPVTVASDDHASDDAEDNGGNQDFTVSEQLEISKLLDAWEEPGRSEQSEVRASMGHVRCPYVYSSLNCELHTCACQERKITLGAIMQFRQALSFMKRKYPFLPGEEIWRSFGMCLYCW